MDDSSSSGPASVSRSDPQMPGLPKTSFAVPACLTSGVAV